MMEIRHVIEERTGQPTLEGAGVHLTRIFGFGDTSTTDPFLLLDDFNGTHPDQYAAGFPWHPHRGIETITYMRHGTVDHGDSLGNAGTIGPGDVQWMTAGSGIIHQEMPHGDDQLRMHGYQLWANLPAAHKMMPPRYREITADVIPSVAIGDGVEVKVICGRVGETAGPVQDIVTAPIYLDVTLPALATVDLPIPESHTALVYVTDDAVAIGETPANATPALTLARLGAGDTVRLTGGDDGGRCLLMAGAPLGEPVAWRGPIVMNTEDELDLAFAEYRNGTFIKE